MPIKTEVLTAKQQEEWQFAAVILSIHLSWWIAIAALLGAIWIFEASYRIHIKQVKRQKELETDVTKLERKRRSTADLQKLTEQLSVVMMNGRDLMAKCSEPHRAPPPTDQEVDAWHAKSRSLIVRELGPVYFARLETPNVEPLKQLPDQHLNMTWNGIRYRVLNLRTFIEELSKP